MLQVHQLLSRGTDGAERAALAVARLCGVGTGGSTRLFRCRRRAEAVRRYGLSADPCSRRQALLRNVRQADGTLVLGRFGRTLEALLKAERTHYCCIERVDERTPARVSAWVARHGIRTLNVIGRSGAEAAFEAAAVLLAAFRAAGRSPSAPPGSANSPDGPAVIAGRDGLYAVAPWPAPRAWRWQEAGGRWAAVADWAKVPLLGRVPCDLAWVTRPVWDLVPPEVRGWVTRCGPCPHGHDADRFEHDLELLETLGRLGRPAADLARAGRWAVLRLVGGWAAAAASEPLAAADAWDVAAGWLAGRQRDLLGRLGFPATASAARVLAKVPRASCEPDVLGRLRALLWNPAAAGVLRRLPRVNGAAVAVLSDPWLRRVVGWPLLRRAAAGKAEDRFAWGGSEVRLLLYQLRAEAERTGGSGRIGVVCSIGGLERAVADLEARPGAGSPPPPRALPGIAAVIEPLADGAALAAEGRAMRHCAARYAAEARRGLCLVYRVLPDPRCGTGRETLQLLPGADGQWRVAQLYGAANAAARPGTRRMVAAWLFFAHCDPSATSGELLRACLAELLLGGQEEGEQVVEVRRGDQLPEVGRHQRQL